MKKKTYRGDQRKQREAMRKEGHAQWWERTQASYERRKPRGDEKARGFNYREHIKMKKKWNVVICSKFMGTEIPKGKLKFTLKIVNLTNAITEKSNK